MFERFSETARRVIFVTRCEASRFGSPEIATEHLLLGILQEAQALLRSTAGPNSVEMIRDKIERLCSARDKVLTIVELGFSETANKALKSAIEAADEQESPIVGPEHLLIGLLRENRGVAHEALIEHALTVEAVRESAGGLIREPIIVVFGRQIEGKAVPNQEFQNAVSDAIKEATHLHSMSATPEHLLLSLLRESDSLASVILREAGLDYNVVRAKLQSGQPGSKKVLWFPDRST